jgi:hypothetical protein
VNAGPVAGTNNSGLVLTRRVTGTTTRALDAVDAVISISPWHGCTVVPEVRPAVLMEAVMLLGVAPLSGEITSQLPQDAVLENAVNPTLAPVLLVMENDCVAGVLVPTCQAKASWLAPSWMAGVPARVTNTGKLIPFVPGALIATAPLNGPGVAGNAVGFTVTCNPPEMLPDTGFMVSQFPPSAVRAVAVKLVRLELVLDKVTDFETGTVLATGNGKLKEFGFAERGLAPGKVSSSTRTEREAPVATMLMKPSSVARDERAGLTETVTCRGVVPLMGLTCSQLLAEVADTATLVAPAEDVINIDCGDMVPAPALKVSCVGLAVRVSVPFWARAVSEKHSRAPNRLARQTKDF